MIRRKGTIVSVGNASGAVPPFARKPLGFFSDLYSDLSAALKLGEKNIKVCRPVYVLLFLPELRFPHFCEHCFFASYSRIPHILTNFLSFQSIQLHGNAGRKLQVHHRTMGPHSTRKAKDQHFQRVPVHTRGDPANALGYCQPFYRWEADCEGGVRGFEDVVSRYDVSEVENGVSGWSVSTVHSWIFNLHCQHPRASLGAIPSNNPTFGTTRAHITRIRIEVKSLFL